MKVICKFPIWQLIFCPEKSFSCSDNKVCGIVLDVCMISLMHGGPCLGSTSRPCFDIKICYSCEVCYNWASTKH